MKTTLLHTALLAASILVSTNASSDTDIYKCRDAGGLILLTDKPCGPGLTAAPVAVNTDESPQAHEQAPETNNATTPATGWSTSEPETTPVAIVARAPSPGLLLRAKPLRRALAADIDTLKQAKLAMLNDDAVWASQRALRD